MTIFDRTPKLRRVARPGGLLAAPLIALGLCLSFLCAPASALVVEPESGGKFGLQPRELAHYYEGTSRWKGKGSRVSEATQAASFNNNSGNPVLHSVNLRVIYWDPQHYYHGDWQTTIDKFLQNLGNAGGQLQNVFAVDSQYTDSTNLPAAEHFALKSAVDDYDPYPPISGCIDPDAFVGSRVPLVEGLTGEGENVCLSDAQVHSELEGWISAHGMPTGLGTVYVMLTPPGVAVCLDGGGPEGRCSDYVEDEKANIEEIEEEKLKAEEKHEPFEEPASLISYKKSFCSYHGALGGEQAKTIYNVIPWSAGTEADPQMSRRDSTVSGFACQDGGFEENTAPNNEIEVKEGFVASKTRKQEEEFEAKSVEEKRQQEEAEADGLENAHIQEPNQIVPKHSEDGGYDSGLPDLIINQIAVELQNTITDPLLNGWQDSTRHEVTDECRNFFLPKVGGSYSVKPESLAGNAYNQLFGESQYYLNDAFDLAGVKLDYPGVPCVSGAALEPHFTAPNPVNAGELAGFNGMESTVTLDWGTHFPGAGSPSATYDTYTWNFGDGTPSVTGYAPAEAQSNSPEQLPCPAEWLSPCAGSVIHSFQYGGTYNVTLTVRDVGGNEASYTAPITVVGPPPPPPPPAPGTEAGNGNGSGSSSSAANPSSEGNGSGAKTTPPPPPAAAASISSHSLKLALRKGLAVSYSVNEQVAGHFEVLLNRTVARKLGIGGALATGLPAGTPPQLIIAKATLVTTRAGHNTVRIKFSKRTAARLAKSKKVKLMLRLIVRNSASSTTTSVLTSYTLGA